jgi:caffeoyl-CoA O-methyltransferase
LEIISELLNEYCTKQSTVLDDDLIEILNYTQNNHPKHHMISGALQGKFLQIITSLLQPNNILEIGTFTGFSALCLAKGLAANGQITTIELREEDAKTANHFFNKSINKNKINLLVGNALEIIPTLKHNWDMVFIDADKINYINYFNLVMLQLNIGGLIIADNVLFHGEVLEQPIKGKNAIAINNFNEAIKSDNRVETIMLSVRDGLSLIRKIKN